MILAVQALRGLAALMVALLHALGEAGAIAGTPGLSPWPALRGQPFEAGVDLFFVISGFVMVHSSNALFGQSGSYRVFLAHRAARVLPLYWAVTLAFIVVAMATPLPLDDPLGSPGTVVASFLLVPWQRPDGSMLPVFRLGWTLNYEVFFYALFACWLGCARRPAVGGVLATLGALVGIGQVLHPKQPQLAFWTDPLLLEFAAGAVLGLARAEGLSLARTSRLLLALAAVVLLPLLAAVPGLHRAIAFGLPATSLVAAASLGRVDALRPAPGLIAASLIVVGDASYALYLTHLFALRALREVWRHFAPGADWLGCYVASGIVASIAAALLVHRLFERPTTVAIRKLLQHMARPARGQFNGR